MDRQARTGDTMPDKSREMTGRSHTLPWWLGGGGVNMTENKIQWPCWLQQLFYLKSTLKKVSNLLVDGKE